MQCEHAQEFLSEYVTGEMDAALAVTLENHLNNCQGCRDTVSGLRSLWASLDEMPVVEPPAAFHATVMRRISEEEAASTSNVRNAPRLPHWRSVVHPRVFAYAAVALIALMGAELVQVQRAALGPFGLVLNALHPAPPLTSHDVTWTPNGEGGGTLTVRLQAPALANGAVLRERYHLELDRKDGTPVENLKQAEREGELSSDRPTVLAIPLKFTPSDTTEIINISLTSDEGGDSRTVAVPLAAAP